MQQRITTRNDKSKKLAFQIDLSETDYVFADIEDVFCIVKTKSNDSIEDAVIKKKFAEGVTLNNELKLLFPLSLMELDEFIKGHIYELSVFCKFSGEDGYNEDVKTVYELEVKQSKSR